MQEQNPLELSTVDQSISFLEKTIRQNISMLIKVSKFTTLFLLEQFGDLQYLFEDLMKKRYRTKIGKTVQCTCHLGNLGHCLHSLYILLRIYRMNQNDQLILKNQYSLEDLEAIKKVGKVIDISIPTTKTRYPEKNQKTESEREWPMFEKQTVCSVCYDQIQNETPIIDCQKCHNYFHTKCLKIWVISKKNEEGMNNTCPMCRSEFQQNIESRLKDQEIFFVKYHQSHGINCTNCGKDILIKLFKCLLCFDTYLCEMCYYGWEHKSHDRFVGKLSKKGLWNVTTRSQYNMDRLNASLEYMKKIGGETDMKLLMGPKYDEFVDSYIKKPTPLQHIINSFLDVEKQVHKKFKKLDFSENDIICCMCKKKKIVGMRRMQCGHFVDQKCLKFCLKKGLKQCPIDKNYMLYGLNGLQLNLN